MADWGYDPSNGPAVWMETVPAAKGKRQSPIDFRKSEVEYSESLAATPLQYKYDPSSTEQLINTCHSVQVTYKDEGSSLRGGPLNHEYCIKQFHLHWGKDDNTGSEHTVEGKQYIAELHLVHWNKDMFTSFGEAASENNGLCVLGMFLKIGAEHPELKKIIDNFDKISYGGETMDLTTGIDPAALLPGNTKDYWTYPGSLTTPPLYESVTWIVFKDAIEVSEAQMKKFRELHEYKRGGSLVNIHNGMIIENYRPPLPKGEGRTVHATFKW